MSWEHSAGHVLCVYFYYLVTVEKGPHCIALPGLALAMGTRQASHCGESPFFNFLSQCPH